MVYKKHIIWSEKDKFMKLAAFVENKTEIMLRVLKMQYTSLLPKHIKWNSRRCCSYVLAYVNTGCSELCF
jgi:hypothetical protein